MRIRALLYAHVVCSMISSLSHSVPIMVVALSTLTFVYRKPYHTCTQLSESLMLATLTQLSSSGVHYRVVSQNSPPMQCSFVTSCKDHPVQLWDAFTAERRTAYVPHNDVVIDV